ncbi:MAG: magnesium and cobalt transport protein CorA [Acidimicrobiia bacterium]|nr:magnesium and cobalt transport protein CorA [Acidimicrobiia bacterium]
MIVDCAVYTKGVRRPGDLPISDALEAASEADSFVWVGLHEPSSEEFLVVKDELGLHRLAVEDAIAAHQRAKLEVYGDSIFVVLKTAHYDDLSETVTYAEMHLFVGPNFVVTVRHGEASAVVDARAALEQDPERLGCGPMAVLHSVMDHVVDGYKAVVEELDNDLAEIEDAVFDPNRVRGFDPAARIFKLKRQVLEFYRNSQPLLDALDPLVHGAVPGAQRELDRDFRDVEDHLRREVGSLGHIRDLLSDVLNANLAQVSVRQNDDMRTISAWLAIGGFPTVVAAIYGMNFEHMPELQTRYGYWVTLGLMALISLALHRRFRQIGWLGPAAVPGPSGADSGPGMADRAKDS